MSSHQIEAIYQEFFRKLNIDPVSGVLAEFPAKKFATYPYIGSKYFTATKKVLFIGMDIGSDETDSGGYQDLTKRNSRIEKVGGFNWHIAGTYCTALYLLKDVYGWQNIWENCAELPSCIAATKPWRHKEGENPLSFVALTNLHKFVTVGRTHRTGGNDRIYLNQETEELWLLKEIEVLSPNTIILQGKMRISSNIIHAIKESNIKIIQAYHPSYSGIEGGRSPRNYVNKFNSV